MYAVLWAEAQAGDIDLLPAFEARDARFRATLSGYLGGNEAMAGVLVALLRGVMLLRPDDVRVQVRTLLERGAS